jgi:hypothetical protein
MDRKRSVCLLLTALLLGGFLAACGRSSIVIGMREMHLPGDWQANYSTFTGVKSDSFQADAGQTLILDYDAQVDKGALSIQVENPADKLVWEAQLQEAQSDSVQILLDQTGRYVLRIAGENASGSWDLQWNIE